ncbi:MAG: molybdopterin-dependent oxidoreductase [Paludibaculum sp.]
MRTPAETPIPSTLTRRGFVRAGGALFVSLALPAQQAESSTGNSVDPTKLPSWLEIHADNTITARTGRTETGTGMSAFYAQTLGEELNVRPESITLILGDTDRTPDGGYSAGFLTGALNFRKVGAYTYQALLALASAQLNVPVTELTVTDGIVSGGGKQISYGQLVQGQHLDLKIPISGTPARIDRANGNGLAGLDGYVVTGDPPMKPIGQYRVVGRSYPMPGIPAKVTGRTQWSCDVKLPGMLHARMIRPATLGSTLISVGTLDRQRFPNAQVVHRNNLVAVVSPDEWEATSAARAVANTTRWTAWSGLPGSENLTAALRAVQWGAPSETHGNPANVADALAGAARKISASYEQPYVRHAPMGPFVAVADVKPDGAVTVWTHSSHSQGLRAQLAFALSVPVEKVVVRWLDQAGQYGRTTFGGDGAEADAAILSQLTGKPVRVQWTLQEDLAWSTVSPGWVADIKAGLDANGHIVALQNDSYMPKQMDARLLGAILAGMPCTASKPSNFLALEWVYDHIPNFCERAFGMANLAGETSTGGLRGNIMRTPGQRQQNFVLEGLINEAAASAGADPIQYRLDHTTDQRLIDVLKATAKEAGWEPRHSPKPGARKSGPGTLTGRGVNIMRRSNAYWVGIAEIAVTPETGVVQVTKFTIGLECGKIINPRQLDRCMKSGLVMGLSETLKEEVTFDKERVTSTDWSKYKILTMAEMPEIRTVQISRDDQGFGTGGEAANGICAPAVAAAFFDATGVHPRRIPLTPAYVTGLLKT